MHHIVGYHRSMLMGQALQNNIVTLLCPFWPKFKPIKAVVKILKTNIETEH